MAFGLFLLVNAALFIRPGEIVPGLEQVSLYLYLVLGCLVVSYPRVLERLRWPVLVEEPITLCILGLLAAIILSHLARMDTAEARERGVEFAKVALYYLLAIAVIDSPRDLRVFLSWLAVFIVGL